MKNATTFSIGQKVMAVKMALDSNYLQVIGTVTDVRNSFVQINASEVLDRFSKKWKQHPTCCGCSAKIENVVEWLGN